MRERGSALLTAVVAVMVLLLVSGILFSFVKNQFTMQTGEEKALKAYYLADAGTSYGIAFSYLYVINGNTINLNVPLPLPPIRNNPFGTTYGGDFKVTELKVSSKYQQPDQHRTVYIITVTCDGYYPNIADPHHIKRTIKKDYAFFIPDPDPDPDPLG